MEQHCNLCARTTAVCVALLVTACGLESRKVAEEAPAQVVAQHAEAPRHFVLSTPATAADVEAPLELTLE